jgi:hypothetical protein
VKGDIKPAEKGKRTGMKTLLRARTKVSIVILSRWKPLQQLRNKLKPELKENTRENDGK